MTWVAVGGFSTGSGFESRSLQMVLSKRNFGEVWIRQIQLTLVISIQSGPVVICL